MSVGLDPEPRVAPLSPALAVMYIIYEPLQLDPALLIRLAAPRLSPAECLLPLPMTNSALRAKLFSCSSSQRRAVGPSGPMTTFRALPSPPADLQAFVLSSVELQVLTGSCFKLRTVHNIPVTSNKDGKIWNPRLLNQRVQAPGVLPGPSTNT